MGLRPATHRKRVSVLAVQCHDSSVEVLQNAAEALVARSAAETFLISAWIEQGVNLLLSVHASVTAALMIGREISATSPGSISFGIVTVEMQAEAPVPFVAAASRAKAIAEKTRVGSFAVCSVTRRVLENDCDLQLSRVGVAVFDGGEGGAEWLYGPDAQPSPSIEGEPFAVPSYGYTVGRASECEHLLHLLEQHQIVSITGVTGIGKSQLVAKFALESRSVRHWQVLWIALSDYDGPGFSRSAAALESVLQGRFEGDDETVIVFDDCDPVLDELDRWVQAWKGQRSVKIITTGTRPLPNGSASYPLRGLELPPSDEVLSLADLEDYDATALFLDSAREVKPELQIGPAEVRQVVQLAVSVDGHPSAMSFAAKQVATCSLADIARGLFAQSEVTGAPSPILRALRWTVDRLRPQAQHLLASVLTFNEFWAVKEAEQIADLRSERFSGSLLELLQSGLIEQVESPASEYRILPSYRASLLSLLKADAAYLDARERHGILFLNLLARATDRTRSDWNERLLDRVDRYASDLCEALKAVADNCDLKTVADLMAVSWTFWFQRNRIAQAIEVIDHAVANCSGSDRIQVARLLNVASILSTKAGDSADAVKRLERALPLAEDNMLLKAAVLSSLAAAQWAECDSNESCRTYEAAIGLMRELGQPRWLAATLVSLVGSLVLEGRLIEGEAAYQEARELFGPDPDSVARWSLAMAAGELSYGNKLWHDASESFRTAIEIAMKSRDEASIAMSMVWLADSECRAGKAAQAAEVIGALFGSGSYSTHHLPKANELQLARLEGDCRLALGDRRLSQLKLGGALTDLRGLLRARKA